VCSEQHHYAHITFTLVLMCHDGKPGGTGVFDRGRLHKKETLIVRGVWLSKKVCVKKRIMLCKFAVWVATNSMNLEMYYLNYR